MKMRNNPEEKMENRRDIAHNTEITERQESPRGVYVIYYLRWNFTELFK